MYYFLGAWMWRAALQQGCNQSKTPNGAMLPKLEIHFLTVTQFRTNRP